MQTEGRALVGKGTDAALEAEVKAARRFKPKLARFILATTAPRNAALQRKANQAHGTAGQQNFQRRNLGVEELGTSCIGDSIS